MTSRKYFVDDSGRAPVRLMDAMTADRLAKLGRVGVVLAVTGDVHAGVVTKDADIGEPMMTEKDATAALRRAFRLRPSRPFAGNTAEAIVDGATITGA